MDDDDLVARVAAGDDTALRELFGRHASWLAVRLRAVLPAAARRRGHAHRAGRRRAGRGRDRHAAGRRLPGHPAQRGAGLAAITFRGARVSADG
jgi:hypothetical protein